MLHKPSVNLYTESGYNSFSLTLLFPRNLAQEGSIYISFVPKVPTAYGSGLYHMLVLFAFSPFPILDSGEVTGL